MSKRRKQVQQTSVSYLFVRARQLEGTILEPPRHIITAARVLAGWGTISESRWPRPRGGPWPPIEPPGLDDVAKFKRCGGHFRARGFNEIRACLEQRVPVQVSLPIHNGWRSPAGGLLELPGDEGVTENHSIVLEAFDDNRKPMKFWNNWGPTGAMAATAWRGPLGADNRARGN